MKRILSLLCLLCCAPLAAQTSLGDYRRAVLRYSWQLKAAAARTEAAAQRFGQARTGFLPQLSLDGSFSATVRRSNDAERWTFSVLPQLVQVVYGGGSVRAAVDRARAGYDIALCDEEFSRLEIGYAADYAYWNLSALELYAAAMRQYVRLIVSLKEVVDRRFEEGYIAKGDVLMIDARLSEARYQLVTAEQRAEVALHNFNILQGADASAPVRLTDSVRDSILMPQHADHAEALERRPDYAAAQLRIVQAEAGIRGARAPFNPQVSVGIGGAWRPHTPNRSGSTLVDGSAFVKLSVPIFHGGERRRAVGVAQALRRESEWNAQQLREEILLEELNGWTAIVQSHAQVDASERSLRIAGENLELSTYSYGEGLVTILDVLQAQLSWIQLYTNDITARYNYALAISDYRRITAGEE
ncbi:TolC family protein [uncultured Alistipes sp.]|uniref:TolC family protein n=1 Tax=uncultured Alistipes sp. TaxID=538949 RepID=UPI002729FA26|nr:TolC family protein [uncultured Alistipes sp.]